MWRTTLGSVTARYDQFCGLARALEVVGERWTLLLVRELLGGPKRYSDLRAALPGIATNILTERLRSLEELALVGREELQSIGVPVYRLTPLGRSLEPAILELIRWGALFLPPRRAGDVFRPEWLALALRALLQTGRHTVSIIVAIETEGTRLIAQVREGAVTLGDEAASGVDVTVEGPPDGILALFSSHPGAAELLRQGVVRVRGTASGRERLRSLLKALVAPPWRLAEADVRPARARRRPRSSGAIRAPGPRRGAAR